MSYVAEHPKVHAGGVLKYKLLENCVTISSFMSLLYGFPLWNTKEDHSKNISNQTVLTYIYI